MGTLLGLQTNPKARKNYGCCACDWVSEIGEYDYMTFAERRAVVIARNNGWRILKGEKHHCQTILDCDGKPFTFRAKFEIHDICIKYDIYEDVC